MAVKLPKNLGLAGALVAYVFWGLMPLYWHLMVEVDAVDILAHRIIWSFVFILGVLCFEGRLQQTVGHIRALFLQRSSGNRRTVLLVVLAAVFASANWLINILGVNTGRVVELGLGTFLTPLATVAIGIVIFGERVSKVRATALLVASLGVASLITGLDRFPTIALSVSATWALYGALKKKVTLEPMESVALEHFLMLPFALGWLLFSGDGTSIAFFKDGFSSGISFVLMGTGVVTSIPMILFSLAAQQLPLTVLGIIQFLSPVLTLLLGVFFFGEGMSWAEAAALACVVTAATLYVASARSSK